MKNINFGLCSFSPFPGEVELNCKRIVEKIEQAKNKKIEILVFPEMAIPGYCLGDLHKNRLFLEKQIYNLKNLILPSTQNITVIVGLSFFDDNFKNSSGNPGIFNGYAVCSNGKIVKFGKKTLLVDEGVLEDSRYFLLGKPEEIEPVSIKIDHKAEIKLGIMVCQDIWDDFSPVKPSAILKNKGAQLLVVLNSSPFYVGKEELRHKIVANRVKETGLPCLYVNTSGIQDIGKNIVIFDGASFAISNSSTFTKSPPFKEDILKVEIDPKTKIDKIPSTFREIEHIELLKQSLVYTLNRFYNMSKVFNGAVLGLSGGIDSAVSALLLAKAIGNEKLLTINMPSIYNSQTTKTIAQKIANALKCEYKIHPIQDVINLKTKLLKKQLQRNPKTITIENMQARMRGNILMEYSQEYGYMVVGNANKTEFQRGYATLYGDILGAIMPLGDVPKLTVFELAHNLDPDFEIFPEELFKIKPSAELSSKHNVDMGKGDPFDYFIESPMGVEVIENGKSAGELRSLFETKKLDPDLWIHDNSGLFVYDKMNNEKFYSYAQNLIAAINNSYFKRVQAPPIPVVSKRAFGMDFRESLFPPPEIS
jgi:NAD+ synthase (glutamine-hydrolysing)